MAPRGLAGAGTGQLHEVDVAECSTGEQRVAVPPNDAAAEHLAVDERASEVTSDERGLVAERRAKASAVNFLESETSASSSAQVCTSAP